MAKGLSARDIRLKRAYQPAAADDGTRILVDRLWPRGLKKSDAAIERWLKDIAPSTALRQWFAHDPARWPEFRRRYAARNSPSSGSARGTARHRTQGARDAHILGAHELRNDAVVLRNVLLGR